MPTVRRPKAYVIGLVLIATTFGVGSSVTSAQTFSDPVMRTIRVVATCDGPAGSSGAVDLHFHTFGSVKVGPPREVSPPTLRCRGDEPVAEVMAYLAVPMIWHAYLRVPDGNSPTASETCEVEGSDLPAVSHCPGLDATLMLEIAEVSEEGSADGEP